jgi:hypothetical protein
VSHAPGQLPDGLHPGQIPQPLVHAQLFGHVLEREQDGLELFRRIGRVELAGIEPVDPRLALDGDTNLMVLEGDILFLQCLQDGVELGGIPPAVGEVEKGPPPDEGGGQVEGPIEGRVGDQHAEAGVQEHQRLPDGLDDGDAVVGQGC